MTKPAILDKSWPIPPKFNKIKKKYNPPAPRTAYDLGKPDLCSNWSKTPKFLVDYEMESLVDGLSILYRKDLKKGLLSWEN